MKRIIVRPGKSVLVSDEALSRARNALKTFGVDEAALDCLGVFTGDVTIGANAIAAKALKASKPKKAPAKAAKRPHLKIFRCRIAQAAVKGIQVGVSAGQRQATGELVFNDATADRGRKLKIIA
ncbi:hypothetical protein [Ideonella sp. YS5]|uniref:hypothetical protein n=1 Tax=Ideonella sp. YS5 TaxID=3453714 RepID=UPI003EEBB9B8